MGLSALDIGIIAAYMIVSLVLGLYLVKRASGSTGDYFLSGRSLPWWLAGTSMVATSFSSDTPLYVTGLVRGHGIYENWQWWCFLFGGIFAMAFLARLWRDAGFAVGALLAGLLADLISIQAAIYAVADVCRSNLLVEIEGVAFSQRH